MKALIFLLLFAIGGYYAYQHFAKRPSPKPAVVAVVPASPKIDPRVQSRVGHMYGEWKVRTLDTQKIQQGSRSVDMAVCLTEIRRFLGAVGIHSPGAVKDTIVSGLRKLGVPQSECDFVYNCLLQEASKDGQKASHNKENG
jgi:hypothetical protein